MDRPLRAHTFSEVHYYLMVTPCRQCGKGPWLMDAPAGAEASQGPVAVKASCKHCGAAQEFQFVCDHALPFRGVEGECINPTNEPSRLIDLAQWLSLFYLLVESATSEIAAAETRRGGYRAALCLAEALKFYGDNELPPESAFFTPATQTVFREHPENFARQKLRDMQAKLPDLGVMARRIARDERMQGRRWWQLWRR